MHSGGWRRAIALPTLAMTLATGVGAATLARAPVGATANSAISPPASIADDCSVDTTARLNAFFASVPTGSTIALPANACYLVSNGPTTLRLNQVTGLTIDGNGATFEQKSYENGVCGGNAVQPVLHLTSDLDLTFNDLNIVGPANCGGSTNEGDYGIELGQATPGNTNITFDGVNVMGVDRDGLAVMPQLGTCCGVNTNITFENGSMSYIGYHVFTPEGVNGLYIRNNQFTHAGNFMDMEVDANGPGNGSVPTGAAQWNVTVDRNTFGAGAGLTVYSLQGSCIPQTNVTISHNLVQADGRGLSILLGGSGSSSCGRDTNLRVEDNESLAPTSSPCGGSIVSGPNCSMIEVADYADVTISGNRFTAFDGTPTYFANTIYVPCITLQGVDTATIENNVCADSWDVWDTWYWQFQATAFPSTSGVTACGNVYWLTNPVAPAGGALPSADPRRDSACTGDPPSTSTTTTTTVPLSPTTSNAPPPPGAPAPAASPSCAQVGPFPRGSAVVGIAATPDLGGYWLVTNSGHVAACGDAPYLGEQTTLSAPIVGIAATPDGAGYYLVASDGGVFTFGDATFLGSTGSISLNKPIVDMAVDPATGGYWLVASDGGIFAFGAPFLGSTGSLALNKPVVAMTAAGDGRGYWLVASDGGIFAYGDSQFRGSTGAIHLNKPVVGMAPDLRTGGYWLVASDGGIFAFDAPFHGSAGSLVLNAPITGMEAAGGGNGYRFVAADGGVFDFGASRSAGTPVFAS
jgi:hypothetical protein